MLGAYILKQLKNMLGFRDWWREDLVQQEDSQWVAQEQPIVGLLEPLFDGFA